MRAAAPLAIGPVLFGASFGLLAGEAGMGTVAAVAMSATTFAGSAQFAAAGTLETGGGALAAVAAAALLNARYLPMGVAAAGAFGGSIPRRFAEAQLIVDESWALAGRSGRFERKLLVGAGLLFYVCWVAGTAAARSSARRSATRSRSASTPPSPRSSSRCSGPMRRSAGA